MGSSCEAGEHALIPLIGALQADCANLRDDRYQSAADLAAALEDCNDYGRWTRDDAQQWWEERETSAVKTAQETTVA